MKVKENTHIILKREDVEKYLTDEQKEQLQKMVIAIADGRMDDEKKLNSYIICNTDEKYFNDMYAILKAGEEAKERGEEYKSILPEEGQKETKYIIVLDVAEMVEATLTDPDNTLTLFDSEEEAEDYADGLFEEDYHIESIEIAKRS
jgi:co-chaperonin GroES (HSP10)